MLLSNWNRTVRISFTWVHGVAHRKNLSWPVKVTIKILILSNTYLALKKTYNQGTKTDIRNYLDGVSFYCSPTLLHINVEEKVSPIQEKRYFIYKLHTIKVDRQ